jgi:hypothetical protein
VEERRFARGKGAAQAELDGRRGRPEHQWEGNLAKLI